MASLTALGRKPDVAPESLVKAPSLQGTEMETLGAPFYLFSACGTSSNRILDLCGLDPLYGTQMSIGLNYTSL